jgi:hypothetical protein
MRSVSSLVSLCWPTALTLSTLRIQDILLAQPPSPIVILSVSACFVCNLVYERREQHFVSTVSNMFQTYPLQELNGREQALDLADGV